MSDTTGIDSGSFRGRHVAVVGVGKSNKALCRYLAEEGARISCFDRKSRDELGQTFEELSVLGVSWSLGPGYLCSLPEYREIFLTPGMKKNLPEIARARANGAVISSETDLLMQRCRGKVVGVTGSAGKTTATTVLSMMLKESLPGRPVYVGGNIGPVLIETVDEIEEDAIVILELSSFQLELATVSPSIALVLNVRPNHLDVHETFGDYVAAKKRIFRFQRLHDRCILNLDDPAARGFAPQCPGKAGFFSLDAKAVSQALARYPEGVGAWLDGDDLVVSAVWPEPEAVASRSDLRVPGLHNVSNVLGAALVAGLAGAAPDGIRRAVRAFRGVEHRIELVRTWRGVDFYNDSIATSPDRTLALMSALQGPLVLILGGYDKGLPFEDLAREIVSRGCVVVTLGNTAGKIEEAIGRAWAERRTGSGEVQRLDDQGHRPDVTRVVSLEHAVAIAAAKAQPGFSVALSPACASFDMFPNFEERGRAFRAAVERLK